MFAIRHTDVEHHYVSKHTFTGMDGKPKFSWGGLKNARLYKTAKAAQKGADRVNSEWRALVINPNYVPSDHCVVVEL